MIDRASNQVVIVKAVGESGAAAAACCATSEWTRHAQVLKRDQREWVIAGDTPSGAVVVKSMVLDRPLDALKRWLGITRLMRQWRGAEILGRHGFVVARPLALWRGRDERGRLVESLAMERLPGKTVLRHLHDRDLAPDDESAVARQIGKDIARLARLGLVNRDHKPSNLLVQPVAGARGSVVAIIDTVAIRRSRPRAALVHMLFELIVEPIGCGISVPLRLRLWVLRAAVDEMGWQRREIVRLRREVRERLAAHGDPTPKVNPLDNGQPKTNAGTSPS